MILLSFEGPDDWFQVKTFVGAFPAKDVSLL